MESKVYNQAGKESGTIKLPETIFGLKWNADLVHQVVTSMRTNMRHPVAHAKDRGEVRGGGKKPWRQKGTGRARHGSIRSPLWVGGGVTHGPTNKKSFSRKVNKKMKDKAISVILSAKLRDGEILFVEDLKLLEPKTKEAKKVLTALSSIKGYEGVIGKKKNAARIALPEKDSACERSFRNFSNVSVSELRNLSPLDLLDKKFLILAKPQAAIDYLTSRLAK